MTFGVRRALSCKRCNHATFHVRTLVGFKPRKKATRLT
jgi:ribosomal protein L37E